jgi:dienelactone hydrolase
MKHSRWRKALAVASVVLGFTAVGVAVATPLVLPVVRFPRPRGPYQVGTVSHHWTDPARAEIFTSDPTDRRELMVQIWYPAEVDSPAPQRAAYLADPDVVTDGLSRLFGIPALAFRGLRHAETNAVEGAAVASAESRYPVLVLLEGLGGFRQANTFQVEELVSHGYVVVALDQPFTSASVAFPDGRVVDMSSVEEMRPLARQSYLPAEPAPVLHGQTLEHGIIPFLGEDVSFVLDRLEALDGDGAADPLSGRLDLSRVGLIGMSLGGIVAGEASRTDPRVKATLVMDAPMPLQTVAAGLDQPTMWLTRPADTMRLERERAGGWPEEEITAHHSTMRATFESLRAPGYFVQVPDISHVDFTDLPSWSPAFRWLRICRPRDGEYAHRVINDYSLSFFDRHLRGMPGSLLDGPSATYPDVTIEVHHPRS